MDSDYSDEEVVENPTFKAAYNLEPLHHNQRLRWDHQVKLIGEKVFDPQIHLCEKCQYPILVYGRMLPCKHVFCLDCAKKYEKMCPRCDSRVVRIEQSALGTVFICVHGAPKHSINGCRRTYLSKRDLQAHIAHRHSVKPSSSSVDRSGEEKLPSSSSQQHHISSTYDRESARDRDRDRERERDRDRGEQVVYRPLDTSHPPPPPLAPSHAPSHPPSHMQPTTPANMRSHPPPTLTIQHNPLRLSLGPIPGQAPPTTMESYMTTGLGGGGVAVGGATRTNQNLITVPIQDEPDNYATSRSGASSGYGSGQPGVPPPHSMAGPPPTSYSAPPPHLGMPPPGVPGFQLPRVPFSSAPLAQAVAQLASMTHALNQQRLAASNAPRLNLPQGPPPTGPSPVSTPSRFPQAQGFGAGGSPMQHWPGGNAPPPRQGQTPPGAPRPPSDGGNYRQYY